MRLERKSLIACTLLLLTGCSASRLARRADSEYDSPDRVPVPIRHADEYNTGGEGDDYEYEPAAPSRGGEYSDPRPSLPPAAPMREPVPAPPAIGVSRVKSVSWLRRFENDATRSTCGDDADVDGCTTGSVSPLAPEYFTEGCVTPPCSTATPSLQSRERINLVEVVRGWNLRRRPAAPKHIYAPRNCGEPTTGPAPGCYASNGCTGNGNNVQSFGPQGANRRAARHTSPENSSIHSGSLAEPLSENGWKKKATHREKSGFTPDELMDLPSNLEQQSDANRQSTPQVPQVPDESEIQASPVLPVPKPVVPDSPAPAPVEQQLSPNSVNMNTRPPMWPRLGQPAPKPANLPVAAPSTYEDSTLPLIQPGRRI